MRRSQCYFAAAPVLALALFLGGCSKSVDETATQEAAAAEAQVAAAEQKLADAERAIQEAQAAQDKMAEAQRTLDAARKDLDAAKRASTAAKSKTEATGASGWSQDAKPVAGAGAAKPAAPPPPPREYTLAAGTQVAVRTTSALSTKDHQAGHRFQATLTQPLEVDGHVIAGRGATVTGEVVESDPGGRVKGVASMSVRLLSVQGADGETIAISTGAFGKDAPASKGKDAAKVGIGAGVGAAIGAIAGGGRGAAIGAAAGSAAGAGTVLATRGEPAVIPSESVVTFTLRAPVTVTEKR
jgi:hypothetical protein